MKGEAKKDDFLGEYTGDLITQVRRSGQAVHMLRQYILCGSAHEPSRARPCTEDLITQVRRERGPAHNCKHNCC